ncbi:MAG TPA: AAA family ATPase [Polyangia bacterium]|nr:AAA family ATPase [Polyangia bacterium]
MPSQALDFSGNRRFQVIRQLGEGGTGVVYEVLDRERGVRAALKTLRTTNAESLMRFKNEFRALQELHHRNLVTLGELIEDGGTWFFTMELIEGVNFLRHVRVAPSSDGRELKPSDAVTIERSPTPRPALADFAAAATLPVGEVAPSPPRFDEPRLRAGLAQLVEGLVALHRVGKVHRDVKPSNVLVERDGRVVLLDFGLITSVNRDDGWTDGLVVGTADYMSPEQAGVRAFGPEADWYSVGVVLYEALTGRLPFDGPSLVVLQNKQQFDPLPPQVMVPGVPRDLDRLCVELLAREPSRRPTDRELCRRIGVRSEAPPTVTFGSASARFVGRARELDQLEAAFEDARRGEAVAVFVHGESGIGKSALVRRFLDGLRQSVPNAVIFEGRCYERETVPYKAFDGVIDALSRHLAALPADDAAALLPAGIGALAQVFPVLYRADTVSRRAAGAAADHDPSELRARAFTAFRELMTALASRAPLVTFIDDFQWADPDSLMLRREVTLQGDVPGRLLIASLRTDAGGEAWTERVADARHLRLERFSPDEARALIAARLRDAGGDDPDRVEAIAAEAEGHPLFIDHLVRHGVESGAREGGSRLQEALWANIRRLEPPARRLLEVVSIAATPIEQQLAASAAELDGGEFTRLSAQLRSAHLVRTGGARGTDPIEPYHDQIRRAVLSNREGDDLEALHHRLAEAITRSGRDDPWTLLAHWIGAGQLAKAAEAATRAADQSFRGLAFDRAAQLYRQALDLEDDGARRAEVLPKLGLALAHAGRSADSADAYFAAASGASASDAAEYERRAAEQLMRSGRIDEGSAVLRKVLARVGVEFAPTPRRALASLIWRRAQLRLRGLGFRERAEDQIEPRSLQRIDALWSASIGLAMVDPIRGAAFQTRNLLLSLEAGEPYRVARALAMEACFSASWGGPLSRRTRKLLESTRALADRIESPHARALAVSAAAIADIVGGRFKRGVELVREAQKMFRADCSGVEWELCSLQLFELWALWFLGEPAELARRVDEGLREAEQRGDLFAGTDLREGIPNLRWLVHDDPDGARRESERATKWWAQSGFHAQHYYFAFAQAQLDLYLGDGEAAHARMSGAWPKLVESQLLQVQLQRITAVDLRGRAALGAGERATALEQARALEREKAPWADALALILRAGAAARDGDERTARDGYRRAAQAAQAADLALHAQAARRRAGQLAGDSQVLAECDAWMRERKIRDPRRLTRLLAPGPPLSD